MGNNIFLRYLYVSKNVCIITSYLAVQFQVDYYFPKKVKSYTALCVHVYLCVLFCFCLPSVAEDKSYSDSYSLVGDPV